VFALAGDSVSDPRIELGFFNLCLLCYSLAPVAWFVSSRRPSLGRWSAIIALVVIVSGASAWLDVPGLLSLLCVPTALAAAVINLPAGATVAVIGSFLTVLAARWMGAVADTASVGTGLLAIWASLAVMYAVHWRIRQLAAWSWEHFTQAREALEEARDRQLELKQALDGLAHANRQLTLLNEKVAGLRLLAEDAQKAKAEFVAKVSHELRTPLNIVVGLTELVVEDPQALGAELPMELLEPMEIVYRNAQHLSTMIEDVLDLSQVEAGRMALRREWVDLEEIVTRAVATVRPLTERKSLYLRVEIPGDLPDVYCDRTRISQVIVNLVSNAARFTEEGGISVRAEERGGSIVVSVSDTGPGILEEDADRIFEPFCQGSTRLWRHTGGSGLGLSISKQFIELHSGRIWLESRPGLGSTFHFRLPVSPPEAPLERATRWMVDGWVEHSSTTRPPVQRLEQRAIVCDGTGEVYPFLSRYADEVEYVDTRNLAQAAAESQRCPAHAVLVNAPSSDELWPLIERATREIPDTPVIGWSCPPRVDRLLGTSVRGYLTKPVRLSDLKEAIKRVGAPVRRILIVDDDPDALRLFTFSLKSIDAHLDIVAASDGDEAMSALRREPPDLILLDVVMPEVNGWQVIEQKNGSEATRDIPVILISALDPRQRPMGSKVLVTALGDQLQFSQLVLCSREIPRLLAQSA
jgi:signal transduction histidine kinase/CheY-like chemotaxis protein